MRKTMLLIQSIVLLEREISSPAPQKRGCFLYGAEHPFRHGAAVSGAEPRLRRGTFMEVGRYETSRKPT